METRSMINNVRKKVNNKIKSVVNGFVRSISTIQGINIPVMINYIIISFYFITDRFKLPDVNNNKYLNLTNNNKKLNVVQNNIWKIIDHDEGNVWAKFAFVWCDNNIIQYNDKSIKNYQWSFKWQDDSFNAISFGIHTYHTKKPKFNSPQYHKIFTSGLIANQCKNCVFIERYADEPFDKDYGIIYLNLDMNEQKLKFTTNESQKETIIGNIINITDAKLCLAIEIPILTTSKIEMINFEVQQSYFPHAFRDIINHLPENNKFGFDVPSETSLDQHWAAIFSKQYID